MLPGDTIAAVSSAPPTALRVVIRLSGPASLPILQRSATVLHPAGRGVLPVPGRGVWSCRWRLEGADGRLDVPVVVAVFPGPGSYTGEDVVEIGVPGSPWIVRTMLEQLLREPGVRSAEPGEFTARAFLHGRLDLTAAEGVAAAIAASDRRQLRAARQLLSGELADSVRAVVSSLAGLLALVEAGIDFSEEDVTFIGADDLRQQVTDLRAAVEGLLQRGRLFGRFSAVPVVALVGAPNAGKSTLLNALAGKPRAVTSPVAGTTRDLIAEEVSLQRGRVRLLDTAGLESPAPPAASDPATPSADPHDAMAVILEQMQRRARIAADTADVLVRVMPPDSAETHWPITRPPDLTVLSKADLGQPTRADASSGDELAVSALTGEGLDALRARLDLLCFGQLLGAAAGGDGGGAGAGEGLALTTRHLQHLHDASESLRLALVAIGSGDELAAAGLREALDHLGRITGEVSPDDVLGRVFATFCIGK